MVVIGGFIFLMFISKVIITDKFFVGANESHQRNDKLIPPGALVTLAW